LERREYLRVYNKVTKFTEHSSIVSILENSRYIEAMLRRQKRVPVPG